MKVIIRGPLLSVTGYGVHTRQIFSWARSRGHEVGSMVVPWGQCTYYINPESLDGLIGEIMTTTAPMQSADISFQVQLPDEWDPNLAKINIGVTAGVESDICSQAWVEACKKMHKIIVPSNFTKSTFVKSGVPENMIVVIPEAHSLTPGISEELDRQLSSLPTSFNFLFFGQLTGHNPENDRKNTFWALRWLAETFKNDKDVGVIVKTNLGRFTTADRNRSIKIFEGLIKEIKTGPYPKFYLAHGMLDNTEISTLYKNSSIKALVAPTRGEGWGLPILDAAASGLPVIATNYSGHLDFLKYVKFLPIEYDMVPVHHTRLDGRVWIEGSKWADPKEDSVKDRLKKFRKGSSLPKEWAVKGAEKIAEEFSLEQVKKRYDVFMELIIDNS